MSHMVQVQIERAGDAVKLAAPYHPALPNQAQALGGRWDPVERVWRFDARDEARVRELARSIYGTDGEDNPELVTIRVTLTRREASRQELWLAGRLVAKRRNWDLPVSLGNGVIIVKGKFPWTGGTSKSPTLGGEGVVLEIRDVPRPAVPQAPNVEIVDGQTTAAAADVDPLAALSDDALIAALERRGYVVIRATSHQPA